MDNFTNKKELSEEDIKNRFITTALNNSEWNSKSKHNLPMERLA